MKISEKLKMLSKKQSMQDLEKDLLLFYDYVLFLKNHGEVENEYLVYASVYSEVRKILAKNNLDQHDESVIFNKSNYITKYMDLANHFDIPTFRNKIFDLEDVKIFKNKWVLD